MMKIFNVEIIIYVFPSFISRKFQKPKKAERIFTFLSLTRRRPPSSAPSPATWMKPHENKNHTFQENINQQHKNYFLFLPRFQQKYTLNVNDSQSLKAKA